MSDKKTVNVTVENMIEELKKNPSSRFSKADFQMLIYAILSDKDFKAKKHLLRNDQIIEEECDIGAGMRKFLDKLLKHAGMTDAGERDQIIDTFEYGVRDIEWIEDAVDEAMYQYSETGKNMRIFREKMLQLTIKKMVRSGKYAGTITYKKTVVDRALALQKRQEKKGKD